MVRTGFIAVALLLVLVGCDDASVPVAQQQPTEPPAQTWPLEWLVEEGSCQNTETKILLANAINLITWADPEGCELAAGTWQGWGSDMQLPLNLTLVVPLVTPLHALEHGADDWSEEEKIAFINDHDNLIILDPVSAQERANLGPALWVPLQRYWCQYASRWQQVKQRYQLTSDSDELGALQYMLEQCPAKEGTE